MASNVRLAYFQYRKTSRWLGTKTFQICRTFPASFHIYGRSNKLNDANTGNICKESEEKTQAKTTNSWLSQLVFDNYAKCGFSSLIAKNMLREKIGLVKTQKPMMMVQQNNRQQKKKISIWQALKKSSWWRTTQTFFFPIVMVTIFLVCVIIVVS